MRKKKRKTQTLKNKSRRGGLEIKNIVRRLHSLLRNHPDRFSFQRLPKNICGLYDLVTKEITIDYRKDIIPTLIHEAIHHWHSDWSEKKVIKEEKRITNLLTPKLCISIIGAIAKNI